MARRREKSRLVSVREFELVTLLLNVVEQSHVLDHDHRLVCERRYQFNLLFRERANFGTTQAQNTNGDTFAQHRYAENSAEATQPLPFGKPVFRVGQHVGNVNGLAFEQSASVNRCALRHHRKLLHGVHEFLRDAVGLSTVEHAAFLASDGRMVGLAQSGRRFDKRLQDSLQIERRAADDLEDIGGCGLLLKRFTQLVEQARVLDGDDSLGGEVLDQLNLLVGERLNLLVIDVDGANQAALLEHWNRQQSSITAELNGGAQQRIALDVSLLPRNVGDLHYLPCLEHTAKARARAGTDRSALTILGVGRRRIIERSRMKRVPVIQVQCAELGLAEARCLLQHR